MPYQCYEENPREFRRAYLQIKTDESIKKQINDYDKKSHEVESEEFYAYGWNGGDFSLTQNPDMKRYEIGHHGYPLKDSYKDLEEIAQFCKEHAIALVLYTSPLYKTLYKNSVEDGYFDFLRKVAQKCEFYNFSSLNDYTKNPAYYFEWSHYRPALGLLVEKMLFGTDEEREKIRSDAGDELWGIKVNAENVNEFIAHLQEQLHNAQ